MRIAYADPPYPGQSKKHYGDHPDYAGEVDHAALVAQLSDFDAWVLHTSSSALKRVLALCPEDVRIGSWGKSFCAWKRNVYPAYCWEPVLFHGGRSLYGERETPRDYIIEPITLQRGVAGAKPEKVCWWAFDFLGVQEDDTLNDLFPGSGAVTRAWDTYWRTRPLDFPSDDHHTEPMFEGEERTVDRAHERMSESDRASIERARRAVAKGEKS